MQNAAILRTQVNNLRATGTLSAGKSFGELGLREGKQLPVSDSDLQRLSKAAYDNHPDGGAYSFVPALSTYETKVFVRPGTNVAVVAFKGTDPKRVVDLYTDIRLAAGHLGDTARISRSRETLKQVQEALPGYKVVLTGHSLGGSIAREVSNTKGVSRAVGFNTGYALVPESQVGIRQYTRGSKRHHDRYHSEHPKFTDYLNTRDAVSIGSYVQDRAVRTRYAKSWGLKAHQPSYYK